MKRRRAAAPYAKALFALAKERDQTELIGRELGDAAATFESVAELRDRIRRRLGSDGTGVTSKGPTPTMQIQ